MDSSSVDWKRVDFWWGDERYVPADSGDRNDRSVGLDLLDVVVVDPARVHAMPAADEAHGTWRRPLRRTRSWCAATAGQFDLVLLGIGPDGHVASLFPGFPQLDVDDRIAVPSPARPSRRPSGSR